MNEYTETTEVISDVIVGTNSEKKAIELVRQIRENYANQKDENQLLVLIKNEDLVEIIRGVLGFEHHYPADIKGNSEEVRITFNKYQ